MVRNKNFPKKFKTSFYIIGAGGHAYSCIDVILSCGYEIKGIYGLEKDIGKNILGYQVKGTQLELSKKIKKNDNLHIAVGHTFSKNEKHKILKLFKGKCRFPKIISPFSIVSPHSNIENGTIVMHGAKVGVKSYVGEHSIINTNSSIDHNCEIGNFSHISTSVTLNGNVEIGNNVFIGSGTTVKDSIKISSNQSIKMCSKVIKDK